MSEPLDSVKSLADRLSAQADRFESSSDETARTAAQRARQSSNDLRMVIEELENARQIMKPIPVSEEMGDLSDLPPSVVRELAAARTDQLEDRIHQIMAAAGGVADIDLILVMLWRRYKEEQKRRFIQNKLYRMMHKGMVFSVPGRKGVYSLEEIGSRDDRGENDEVAGEEIEIASESGNGKTEGVKYDDLDDEVPF